MKQQILVGLFLIASTTAAFADTLFMGDIVRHEELLVVKGYITCNATSMNADKPNPKEIVYATYDAALQVGKYFEISGKISGHQFNIHGNLEEGTVYLSMMDDVPVVNQVLPPNRYSVDMRFGSEDASNADLHIVRDRTAISFGCTRRLSDQK
jgi:hypothetical protein